MVKEIKENLVKIVILDVSGVYVQIYDQGYFDRESIQEMQQRYSNKEHWRVLVLD